MLTEHIVRVCTVCVQSQAVIPGIRDEDEAARRDRRAIVRDSRRGNSFKIVQIRNFRNTLNLSSLSLTRIFPSADQAPFNCPDLYSCRASYKRLLRLLVILVFENALVSIIFQTSAVFVEVLTRAVGRKLDNNLTWPRSCPLWITNPMTSVVCLTLYQLPFS